MDKFQSLSANRLLFDLASRLGSLEGYLYAEENVDKSYLPNWLLNIDREFNCLSTVVKDEIQADYLEVVRKIHALLQRLYGEQDPNTAQLGGMIAALVR
ncbi:MAG TPA: hypothetical protein VGA09_02950 [Candidatus Binatia bacterium]